MNNNELFLDLYNKLDDLLKDHYNAVDYKYSLILKRINELNNSPSLTSKQRAEKLDIIRNLRNSLVHIERFDDEDNFVISNALIETLKQEIDSIKRPLIAIDIAKPIKNVLIAKLEDKVIDIANLMLKYGFTHIPVIKDNKLFGVFSENTIFSRFANKNNINVDEHSTIREYKEFIMINNHSTECFLFIKKDELAIHLIDLFKNKINNKRLVMVFVTENGKNDSQILGIITPYDLLKI